MRDMGSHSLKSKTLQSHKIAKPDARADSELHELVLTGSTETLQEALAQGADPNVQNASGSTPLHYAASQNNIPAIKALIAAGADPLLSNKAGLTPVEIGIFMGTIGRWGV